MSNKTNNNTVTEKDAVKTMQGNGFFYNLKKLYSDITIKKIVNSCGIIAGIIVFMLLIINIIPIKSYVIITDSMKPKININDFVIINTNTEKNSIKEGDIIAFKVDFNNNGIKDVVIHYYYSSETGQDGKLIFKTIAENKTQPDNWEIPADDIIGVYITHFPKIGAAIRFLFSPLGIFVLIADILIITWLLNLNKNKTKKENDNTKKENDNILNKENESSVIKSEKENKLNTSLTNESDSQTQKKEDCKCKFSPENLGEVEILYPKKNKEMVNKTIEKLVDYKTDKSKKD